MSFAPDLFLAGASSPPPRHCPAALGSHVLARQAAGANVGCDERLVVSARGVFSLGSVRTFGAYLGDLAQQAPGHDPVGARSDHCGAVEPAEDAGERRVRLRAQAVTVED